MMREDARNELSAAVLWVAVMLGVAFVAAYMYRHGYIDDHVRTLVIATNGLWIVWYGNRIPKAFFPGACTRRAKRIVGWSMVLSGLVYAGSFAFAPIPLALTIGTGAVLAGILVSLGYYLWLAAREGTKAA